MGVPKALDAASLYRRCEAEAFAFATTAELAELTEVFGQERALAAVRFGIGLRRDGYNIYVLGPAGHGKRTMVRQCLQQRAAEEPTPPDWCYVNNFERPHAPLTLKLPAGAGQRLRRDMEDLVGELRVAIPGLFEKEEYRSRRKKIDEEFQERQAEVMSALEQEAQAHHITTMRTAGGIAFAPTAEGKAMSPDEFARLPEKQRKQFEADVRRLEVHFERALRRMADWRKQRRRKVEDLNRQITTLAVGNLIGELRMSWAGVPDVLAYLDAVQQDVIRRVEDFTQAEEEGEEGPDGKPRPVPPVSSPAEGRTAGDDSGGTSPAPARTALGPRPVKFRRYDVNVLVDRSDLRGAPVIYEDYPTLQNLVGRVEYLAHMGALVTDFTLIKAGAIHKANGGYLVVEARKLLNQPYAWEALKRALMSREARTDSVAQLLDVTRTVSLDPEPMPLDVKVVLLGDRALYYLLYQLDPEFIELFKVEADIEDSIDRTNPNQMLYARLIGTLCRREALRPLDREAVARVIEQATRWAGHQEEISVHVRGVVDLLREADYWANQRQAAIVGRQDVQRAIDEQELRADRPRRRLQREIERGTLLIDTDGRTSGQVNALSVIDMGNFAFARPSRVTATARVGRGEVIDIERQVQLGGPIHSKGVLILSQFLAARYCPNKPLSLAASVVFEQSYGGVEGDSASLAELCALLSALADVPLRQDLAVTGSVNQQGQVQAVGGVNEKIEGFFDVCDSRGLTGRQGVLIPAANAPHLMLRSDVVQAAASGRFQVFPISTVDEAIGLLTGLEAGARDPAGRFAPDTFNGRVESRLLELAAIRRRESASEEA